MICCLLFSFFFFFNDTATTEIYTLSLHDALPIFINLLGTNIEPVQRGQLRNTLLAALAVGTDRKSTRLNSSHQIISYAVFCLKKKKRITESENKESEIVPRKRASIPERDDEKCPH